ncbi:MAG: HIG1 domain-containing protein [Sphingomicrobium sp.]
MHLPAPWGFRKAFSKVYLMTFILILLIGGFAIAAATALIRGLMAFFGDSEFIRENENVPRQAFGLQQNRMMTQRVLFQGIAIFLVVLLGALASQR